MKESVTFEAVKTSISQTSTGIILRLAIHPNDLPKDLMLSPVGTRYGVAMVMIGDDENPTMPEQAEEVVRAIKSAGLLCRNSDFQKYMVYSGLAEEETEEAVVKALREHLEIKSRAEMRTNEDAFDRFIELRKDFQDWYRNRKK